MKNYTVVNGTSYDTRTPHEVVRILEDARSNRTRLKLHFGDAESGVDWLEEHEIHGLIGRSTGVVKVSLLLANRRSTGGGAILDHCIVRIRVGHSTIYQHPNYHHGDIELRRKIEPVIVPGRKERVLTVDALRDGKLHASFEGMEAARRWVHKLGLKAPIVN